VTWPGTLDRRDGSEFVVVASYSAYEDAARARDRLVADGVPADAVSIDGIGLRPVEEPASERVVGQVILAGALGGALAGAVLGFVFGVLSWDEPLDRVLALALSGLLLGALVGAATGILLALAPPDEGSRPFLGLRTDTYTVAVEPAFADRAAGLLVRRRWPA
jgi:hypothetical protein